MTDTSNKVNTHNGHEYVDLGLPSGLLWATCNVGASSPEQSGLYFAWGETVGYTADHVKSGERSFDDKSHKAKVISIIFSLKQDTANHYMGGKWRVPTKDEWRELLDNCDTDWTDDYNGTRVAGRVFTSKINGNLVFFPAAGRCLNSSVSHIGPRGYYWSASWYSSSSTWYLCFGYGLYNMGISSMYYGQSVRGVCKR